MRSSCDFMGDGGVWVGSTGAGVAASVPLQGLSLLHRVGSERCVLRASIWGRESE
jgi:hypothetical protein